MKKPKILLLSLAAAFVITGCSSQAAADSAAETSTEMESLRALVEELQNENADLKAQLASMPEEASEEETASPQTATPVAVGDTITTDTMELTINKAELTYDVLPDDTSGYYTHYEADAGNVFIHLDMDIKNLGKQNLSCDDILYVTADYNGGYTYTGFGVPEDGKNGFTYSNLTSINPLETLGMHYLLKCPQEVEETDHPLFIIMEPANSEGSYVLTIR